MNACVVTAIQVSFALFSVEAQRSCFRDSMATTSGEQLEHNLELGAGLCQGKYQLTMQQSRNYRDLRLLMSTE